MASSKSQTILCHVCLKDFSDSIDLDPSDNCHRRNHSNLLRRLDESFVKTSMHKLLKSCILELKTRVISFDEILKFIFSSRAARLTAHSARDLTSYALDLFMTTSLCSGSVAFFELHSNFFLPLPSRLLDNDFTGRSSRFSFLNNLNYLFFDSLSIAPRDL